MVIWKVIFDSLLWSIGRMGRALEKMLHQKSVFGVLDLMLHQRRVLYVLFLKLRRVTASI